MIIFVIKIVLLEYIGFFCSLFGCEICIYYYVNCICLNGVYIVFNVCGDG